MDSLTQMVLGAAVGEIALGKKIGNRALIWGAIGGTIPDLDVFAGQFMTDMDAFAFHRGITHSIFFSVAAPLVFGGLVHKLYQSGAHKSKVYKGFVSILNLCILIGIAFGINYLFREGGMSRYWVMALSIAGVAFLIWRLYRHYLIKELEVVETHFIEWYWLFFLAFATHWLLDSFTAFGTQIFQPFSDYRVAFDNIAVADPLYTIPFLICVILTACFPRGSRKRKIAHYTGLILSCGYMLLTLFNKSRVDHIFDRAMEHRGIEVVRMRTTPTILNNVLWSCVAEGEDAFYIGQYSLFDSNPNLHYLSVLPKQDSLIEQWQGLHDFEIIEWFSNGYLTVFPTDSAYYLCDLRYGGMRDTIRSHKDLVFNFKVKKDGDNWQFLENREPFEGSFREELKKFWTRIKGY